MHLKEKIAIFLVFSILLFLRLFIVFNSSLTFYSDDAIYASLARNLIEGHIFAFFHPYWQPLFPAISALVFILGHFSWEDSLRIVSSVAGSLIIVPVFFFTKKFFSFWHSVIFCFFVTLFDSFLENSLLPLSDTLAAFIAISSLVVFYFAIEKGGFRSYAFGGFLLGCLYLTRPEGVLFIACIIFYLGLCALLLFVRRRRFSHFLLAQIVVSSVFLVTASPYLVALKNQTGRWSLTPKTSAQVKQGHSFSITQGGTTWAQEVFSTSPNYHSDYFSGGVSYVSDNIFWFFPWYLQKLYEWRDLFLSIFPPWTMFVLVIGIFSFLVIKPRLAQFYLILVLFVGINASIFVTPERDPRYLMWTWPFFLFFFYFGILKISNLFSKVSLFLPLLGFMALPFFPYKLFVLDDYLFGFTKKYQHEEIYRAGLWISEHTQDKKPLLLARHEGVEFYSRGRTIYTPQTTLPEVLSYAEKMNVDFVVALHGEVSTDRELLPLLDPEKIYGLEKVYHYPTEVPKVIIYKLGKKQNFISHNSGLQ